MNHLSKYWAWYAAAGGLIVFGVLAYACQKAKLKEAQAAEKLKDAQDKASTGASGPVIHETTNQNIANSNPASTTVENQVSTSAANTKGQTLE